MLKIPVKEGKIFLLAFNMIEIVFENDLFKMFKKL
jgi:hypothetical protein